jgi:hypothetical protein
VSPRLPTFGRLRFPPVALRFYRRASSPVSGERVESHASRRSVCRVDTRGSLAAEIEQRMQIAGLEFSGFPGRDSANLRTLDYAGRVAWFRYRFELVFLTPFRRLVGLESPDCYIWLCVFELAGGAISALANLAIGQGQDHAKFTATLKSYMPTFARATFALDDPRPGRHGQRATTPAEHFYQFFRNGLAHSFSIEWGGIQHREELTNVGPDYLFQTTQGAGGEHGLGVVPREFVEEFEAGCQRILESFEAATSESEIRGAFEQTFERVFLTKARAPLP